MGILAIPPVPVASGSFVGSSADFTVVQTPTIFYFVVGFLCSLLIPAFTAVSNSVSFTITGAPAILIPNADSGFQFTRIIDNSTNANTGFIQMRSTGVIVVNINVNPNSWTAANNKGIINPTTLTYSKANT